MTEFVRFYHTQAGMVLVVKREGQELQAWTPGHEADVETVACMVATVLEVSPTEYSVTHSMRINGVVQVNAYIQFGSVPYHGYGEDAGFAEDALAKALVAAFNGLVESQPHLAGRMLLSGSDPCVALG